MTQDPIENYKFMLANNICTSRPNLYDTWAWELERCGNFKGAEKVRRILKELNLSNRFGHNFRGKT
jgi:hypothetical protein